MRVCKPNADTPSTSVERSQHKRLSLLTAVQLAKRVGTGNGIAQNAALPAAVSRNGLSKVVMGVVR
jgi:hypothetical protein